MKNRVLLLTELVLCFLLVCTVLHTVETPDIPAQSQAATSITEKTYKYRGVTYTDKDKATAKKLHKKIEDGKQAKTKSKAVTVAFDKMYLKGTNHTCVESYKKKVYKLYKKGTMHKFYADVKRIKSLNSAQSFVKKQSKAIIKASGANKAKSVKSKLKKIENYFIKHYSYDSTYKTGERTKWSQYQDKYGANVYYLYKKNKGICTDFVTAYQQICKYMGIDCKIEFGGTTDSTVRSHAWNVVRTDTATLYKDITLDISEGKRKWCTADPKTFLDKHHMMVSY